MAEHREVERVWFPGEDRPHTYLGPVQHVHDQHCRFLYLNPHEYQERVRDGWLDPDDPHVLKTTEISGSLDGHS